MLILNFILGYGSVLNLDGEVEMDACIMIGCSLNAGAVTCVKDIKNPIRFYLFIQEALFFTYLIQ